MWRGYQQRTAWGPIQLWRAAGGRRVVSVASPAIETTATVDESATPDVFRVTGSSRRSWVAATVLVGLVVAAVRWRLAHHLEVFGLIPDEAAQLAMARTLAGDRWSMLDYSTFRPGYSVLISPIWWFTEDPATGLQAVWVANAALGGLAAALLVLAARRLTTLGPLGSGLTALAVALAPALLFTTRYAWAEALVQVVVVAFVLALLRFADSPTLGRGALAVALAAGGFTVHSRLLPLLLVLVATVAWSVWHGRIERRTAAAVVAVAGVALLASSFVAGWVVDLTWTQPFTTNSFSGAVGQWRQVGSMFATGLGHVWYQLVATFGLAGLGAWVALRPPDLERAGDVTTDGGLDRSRRRDGVLVVLVVLALMALSVAFLAGRARADRIVYGRYTDPASALLVIVGIGAIVSHGRRLWRRWLGVAGVTVVVALVLGAVRGDELGQPGMLRPMILGIQALMANDRSIPLAAVTVLALVGMTVLAAVTLLPSRARAVVLVSILGVGVVVAGVRTHDVLDRSANARRDARVITEVVAGPDPLLPPGAPLRLRVIDAGVDAGREGQRQRGQLYQFFLPGHRVDLDGEEPVPTPYVIAPSDDPVLRMDPDAELLWREPSVEMGLWYVPVD